jgi:hypothetical protein
MIVQFLDENNDMEQIGDLREIDISKSFSNLLDAMAADPDWEPHLDGFLAQLTNESTTGFASVSVGYAWFSSDGLTWQRIDSTGPLDGGEFAGIAAIPDGFVATASSTYKPGSLPGELRYLTESFESSVVWQSADGITWTEATGLTSGHGFDTSRLVDWQGELVEHVGIGTVRSIKDDTKVWTLTDSPHNVFSDMPTGGMRLNISEFGLIGTPSYGWWGPDATELLFSVDGTNWNRWEPTEFDFGGPRESSEKRSGDVWIVGVGSDFVVVQLRKWDESSASASYSLWVGRLP